MKFVNLFIITLPFEIEIIKLIKDIISIYNRLLLNIL